MKRFSSRRKTLKLIIAVSLCLCTLGIFNLFSRWWRRKVRPFTVLPCLHSAQSDRNVVRPETWTSSMSLSNDNGAPSSQSWRMFFSQKQTHWDGNATIEWTKLSPQEVVLDVTSTQVGVNNYFNIVAFEGYIYLYSRCDCKERTGSSEVGQCACVQSSEDNFQSKKILTVAKFVLAFFVFIDKNPSTPRHERVKAVYGIRERFGRGDWWLASSADGKTFSNIAMIWNRKSFIDSQGGMCKSGASWYI